MKTFSLLLVVIACSGCMKPLDQQVQKDPERGIIGKKTQDIGKFDPQAGKKVSDSKVRVDDPLLYGAQAYGPMVEQISKGAVAQALKLYEAEHGRYPRDYDEFMDKIIKANNIRLPVLPFGHKYQYDETKHELVVVKP